METVQSKILAQLLVRLTKQVVVYQTPVVEIGDRRPHKAWVNLGWICTFSSFLPLIIILAYKFWYSGSLQAWDAGNAFL